MPRKRKLVERRIAGEKFYFRYGSDSKIRVKERAKSIRRQGPRARVIKINAGPMMTWAVYATSKRTKRKMRKKRRF